MKKLAIVLVSVGALAFGAIGCNGANIVKSKQVLDDPRQPDGICWQIVVKNGTFCVPKETYDKNVVGQEYKS